MKRNMYVTVLYKDPNTKEVSFFSGTLVGTLPTKGEQLGTIAQVVIDGAFPDGADGADIAVAGLVDLGPAESAQD